jgi:hypothetical protein
MASESRFTPFTEPEIVAAYLRPTLERLALTFSSACIRTRAIFEDRGWTTDAALAAYLIRKDVLESLKMDGLQVEEENLEIERKALCGLLLTLPLVQLKIRKSKNGEIPAAGSQQSLSFYNWNLLVFPQADNEEILPLHLLLLWNDNRDGELETLLLVCVEGNDWRWRLAVYPRTAKAVYDFKDTSLDEAAPDDAVSDEAQDDSFAATFDSANEDVPMKLTAEDGASTPEETEIKADKEDDQSEPKKRAQ